MKTQTKGERLKAISGPEPTQASTQRYQKRVMAMFLAPDRSEKDTDETYAQKYSEAMSKAQTTVRPPSLPIIGHGQQLAAKRMAELSQPQTPDFGPSRQVLRRSTLKANKAMEAAAAKAVIRDRRQKKRA